MARLSLPVASYRHRSTPASPSRLVNVFFEQLPPDAKSPGLLCRAPGLSSYLTVGNGPIQGVHADHGLLYVVSGGTLYSVTSTPTATSRGSVGSIASPSEIDMDSNVDSVVVVNPPDAYYLTNATTFGQITDTDFTSRGAGDVEFIDNYMAFREPDTGRWFAADLGSPSSFDALNFATAEGSPDTLVGMKTDHAQEVLFGERSVEIWQNTGISGFPFERVSNGLIEQGCLNGRTIAKADQSLYWVAEDFTVRRLDGVTPMRVSTHAIEQWLRTTTILSLRGYSYTQEGHVFYVLTAPEGCYAFDVTTQQWAERQSFGYETWNWGWPTAFAGNIVVGSTTSNMLATLDPEVYAELGSTQRAEWTYQPVYAEGARAFHDRLELIFEPGVGLTTGQGSDPEVMLDFSDDGGITWKSLPNKKLGQIGHYANRCAWHGLGSARQRVYRAAVSDPVKVFLTDTQLEVRMGRL